MVLFLFVILICYLPILDNFIPRTNFGAGIPDLGPVRLGTFFLFLFFIMHAVIKKDVKIVYGWLVILMIFYMIVVTSIMWSEYSYNRFIIQEIFNFAFVPLFMTVVSLNLFSDEKNANEYIKHMVLAAFIMAIIGIVQTALSLFVNVSNFRAAGTFGNPNSLAIILVLTLPCVFYATEKKLLPDIYLNIVNVSVMVGILFTVSRKGIITMVICYLLNYFIRKKYKKMMVVLIGFILLAVSFSGYSVITQRFQESEFKYHLNEKWAMTKAGWEMFKTSPIIGLGYQGYYENFSRFLPYHHKNKYDAHNIYITALANYGMLGFVFFITIFLYPLKGALTVLRQQGRSLSGNHTINMAILCISCLIPFMISGWFSGGLFYDHHAMSLLYTNMALFVAVRYKSNMDKAAH